MLIAFCPAEMNDGDKISINSKFDSIVESINVGDVNSDFHSGWMTWAASRSGGGGGGGGGVRFLSTVSLALLLRADNGALTPLLTYLSAI